jgi:GxxExxY protein
MVSENAISGVVLDAAIAVHREMGPGMLESVYERALAQELELRGLKVERQVPIAAAYKGVSFDEAFRADLIVEGVVVVEVKSVERLAAVHLKQVRSYVRFTGLRLGLLVNFGGETLVEGFKRIANDLPEDPAYRTGPRPTGRGP